MNARSHATPATQSLLVAGRTFTDASRALDWAQHTADRCRLPLVVWMVNPGGPIRLKLVSRVEPAPRPA